MNSLISRTSSVGLLLLLGHSLATAQHMPTLLACPWCGAADAPSTIGASSRIAPVGEPGIPLEITGTVRESDGRTPAAGVVIYAYHANAHGLVASRGDQPSHARSHGDLRGWVRTDARGHYRFMTIRPASTPGHTDAALIHMTVTPSGGREALVDPIEFDDDPLFTPAVRSEHRNMGGSGIVRASTDASGLQHVVRDIVLDHGTR